MTPEQIDALYEKATSLRTPWKACGSWIVEPRGDVAQMGSSEEAEAVVALVNAWPVLSAQIRAQAQKARAWDAVVKRVQGPLSPLSPGATFALHGIMDDELLLAADKPAAPPAQPEQVTR